MLKIIRNDLFFKNVTYHWNPHTTICITCTMSIESRLFFLQFGTQSMLLERVISVMEKICLSKFSLTQFPFSLITKKELIILQM